MASLKEVKGRIATVNNTRKITSAMKMVASAKLHKAQGAITNMLPYERSLHRLFTNFLSGGDVQSCYTVAREVKRIALVVFSSNSSLCGGFNANVIKHTTQWLDEHQSLGKEQILVYPVGKKVADALVKQGYAVQGDFQHMADKPSYERASDLASKLIDSFTEGEVEQVMFLYNHFASTASQPSVQENYLPLALHDYGSASEPVDYILEPDPMALVKELLPKVLMLKMYTVVLDANAAEHAARTVAMQVATDNAQDLIADLEQAIAKA